MRRVSLGGQTTIQSNGHLYVWLREGAFMTAGKYFGWTKKCPGLGVNDKILQYAIDNNLRIRVLVDNNNRTSYETDPYLWMNKGSVYWRRRMKILVLPWHREFFTTINGDFESIVEKM